MAKNYWVFRAALESNSPTQGDATGFLSPDEKKLSSLKKHRSQETADNGSGQDRTLILDFRLEEGSPELKDLLADIQRQFGLKPYLEGPFDPDSSSTHFGVSGERVFGKADIEKSELLYLIPCSVWIAYLLRVEADETVVLKRDKRQQKDTRYGGFDVSTGFGVSAEFKKQLESQKLKGLAFRATVFEAKRSPS